MLRKAQAALDGGASQRETARRVDVSHFAIAHAIRRGRLRKPADTQATIAWVAAPTLSRPLERAAEDQSCEAGVAVQRTLERALACSGKLAEAEPTFEVAEAVPNAGVLLAVPALKHEGLLEVGAQVYSGLSNGFFGLRSVLLTFAFMALLRIKTPEQLTEHDPGTLGLLLGLDRVPEVKTLRRTLAELGERGRARTLMTTFTERWAQAPPEELGILYVDGHVRPYHGRTHVLPKQHVQQRGRPMPGTKDFHVNDRNAEPLFFVTADATEGLLETLDETLLPGRAAARRSWPAGDDGLRPRGLEPEAVRRVEEDGLRRAHLPQGEDVDVAGEVVPEEHGQGGRSAGRIRARRA